MVSNLLGSNANAKQNVAESGPNANSSWNRQFWIFRDARRQSKCYFGTYVAIFLLIALATLVLFIPLVNRFSLFAIREINPSDVPCGNSCRIELVESIPEGMQFEGNVTHSSTADVWLQLIESSNTSIEIASFYWTLRENEMYPHPSSEKVVNLSQTVIQYKKGYSCDVAATYFLTSFSLPGEEIYKALLEAGLNRSVSIRIAQNEPGAFSKNTDTEYLQKLGAAEVRSVNFTKLLNAGVLHSKFWIFDRKHVYIGSANMDWRALTQVKELGATVYDCPCVAEDLAKIFEVYWTLGVSDQVPSKWPEKYSTKYNADNPLIIPINNSSALAYISSSPPSFSPKGRTHDLDALLRTISGAKKFVYIAVMDYFPLSLYTKHYKFWPTIDNEIRRAVVERGVNVRILISQWKSTRRMIYNFMNSLERLNRFDSKVQVEVKKFKVESTPDQNLIPYARVNHNKYMVTDNGVFIGTSNWSADYFTDTAGVSFVMTCNNNTMDSIRKELVQVFERDWFSNYSHSIY